MATGVFPPTIVPALTADDFAKRMVELFPKPWTSDEARAPGGVLYTLFLSLGTSKTVILDQLLYALEASRVSTAIGGALDSVALDFFGSDVVRTPGEPDSAFRNTIMALLLQSAATRPAMNLLLTQLIGAPPRLMEPWSIADTAAWDLNSYYDVDTVANPARWGDPGLRYQGFVECARPSFAGLGQYPVLCYDAGFCWDTPASAWLEPSPEWYQSTKRLDALILRSKAFGTRIWRKYLGQALVVAQRGSRKFVPAGATFLQVDLFPASQGLYAVMGDAHWNTETHSTVLNNQSFILNFEVPSPPGGSYVDYLISPVGNPAAGTVTVLKGAEEFSMPIPYGANTYTAFAECEWNSLVWIKEVTDLAVTFKFQYPPQENELLSYLFVPLYRSATVSVDEGAISLPLTLPFTPLSPSQFFVMPSWNTTVPIDTTNINTPIISFSNSAPADAFITWAIHEG